MKQLQQQWLAVHSGSEPKTVIAVLVAAVILVVRWSSVAGTDIVMFQNGNSKHPQYGGERVGGLGYYVDEQRYRRKSNCIRCNSSGDSFQSATRWMVLVSQFFGVMPLIGIGVSRKSQRQRLSFSWYSPTAIYAILLVLLTAFETGCCILQIFDSGFFFGNVGALTFYLLSAVSRALCLLLALHWPRILHYWRCVEEIFLELPYTSPAAKAAAAVDAPGKPRRRCSLAIRANVTFGIFIFLALGELLALHGMRSRSRSWAFY